MVDSLECFLLECVNGPGNDCVTIESVTIKESINSKFHVSFYLDNFQTPVYNGLLHTKFLFLEWHRHFRKWKMKNGGFECVAQEISILYN